MKCLISSLAFLFLGATDFEPAARELLANLVAKNYTAAVKNFDAKMKSALPPEKLRQVFEVVTQLRGEAGARQVKGARIGLALSWRGVPTTTAAAVVLAGGD